MCVYSEKRAIYIYIYILYVIYMYIYIYIIYIYICIYIYYNYLDHILEGKLSREQHLHTHVLSNLEIDLTYKFTFLFDLHLI